MEESYVVVSDLHLGARGSHNAEFCDFLRWCISLPTGGKTLSLQCKGADKDPVGRNIISFYPPTRCILLGDILELWDPQDQNRDNVIRDILEPMSLLHEMNGDKIYVTGNHDEDIGEIARQVMVFPWKGEHTFSLYERHYPEPVDGINRGIEVNGIRYSFLHGHQFDRQQVTYTLGRILHTRFDPVDVIGDLANVSFTKTLSFPGMVLISLAWIFFSWLLVGSPSPLLTEAATDGAVAAFTLLLLSFYPRARQVLNERRSTSAERVIIGGIFLGPALACILLFSFSTLFWPLPFALSSLFLPPIAFVLTFLFLAAVVPKGIAVIKRKIYDCCGVKDQSVDEVLKNGYVASKDTMNVDVVLFGHTHRAGWAFQQLGTRIPGEKPGNTKLFINTGCWTDVPDDRPVNTFAYIDKTGVYLLEWIQIDMINCLFHFPQRVMAVGR